MFYTIYKITNRVNNKIYIGKHQTENLDDGYMGSGTVLLLATSKYGFDKFDKEILYVFDNEEQMNSMEKEIVNEEFLLREDVYNLNVGGEGGFGFINDNKLSPLFSDSPNALSKSARSANGKIYGKIGGDIHGEKVKKDNEYRKICSARLRNLGHWNGRRHSSESKAKIGEANSISQKGDKNSNYGKCWIYNDEEKRSASVPKNELDSWIQKGWKLGRKLIW